MGFLDWIGSAVDFVCDRVEKVKDAVVNGVEEAVDRVRDKLSDALDALTGYTSSERSYNMEESDVNTTERLNTILKQFTETYMKSAVKIENACIEAVEKYYEQLMPIVEQSQSIGYSKSSMNRIKNNKLKIRKSIQDSIRQPLSKRLSLDDMECLKILKMESGTKKKRAMEGFVKNVIGEALENLADTVSETLYMQLEDIEEGLWEISEKQEKEFANLKKYFDNFAASNSNVIEDREKDCVLPLVVFSAAGEVLQLIA